MQRPDPSKRPSQTAFGRMMADALRSNGRIVHSSGADGVCVKGSQPRRVHRLELTYYPLHGMLGPCLPRLKVNRNTFRIPQALFKRWDLPIYNSPFQREVTVEVTFLPEEAEAIAAWTNSLIKTMEDHESNEWPANFPFEVRKTTPTNIWTKAAKDFAGRNARRLEQEAR